MRKKMVGIINHPEILGLLSGSPHKSPKSRSIFWYRGKRWRDTDDLRFNVGSWQVDRNDFLLSVVPIAFYSYANVLARFYGLYESSKVKRQHVLFKPWSCYGSDPWGQSRGFGQHDEGRLRAGWFSFSMGQAVAAVGCCWLPHLAGAEFSKDGAF